MNRQQRRLLQRQGQSTEDDLTVPAPVGVPEAPEPEATEYRAPRSAALTPARRTSPRQFMHEVNVELRKVAWPSRTETANYAIVVFIAVAVLMALIFGLDIGFSKVANFLFK